ncbi:hAT family C-terminal dimerization region [Phytophthora infestans]|uniref:HAT family C-terminal dimerization region n=1 Tax=Phytophthora infestans TaxID=4787 RepID=A0A8S9V6G5_PHYIN|nr:hAT family C-terminal dimerization region [Phytophthora infestans]
MLSAVPAPEVEWTPALAANEPPVIFSEDLMDFFEPNEAAPQTAPRDVQEARVEKGLERWISEPAAMNSDDKIGAEHILTFWSQQTSNNYQFLPTVARIIFAVPTSSIQIERCFGVNAFATGDWGTAVSTDSCCTRSETYEKFDIVVEDVVFRLMNTQRTAFSSEDNHDSCFTSTLDGKFDGDKLAGTSFISVYTSPSDDLWVLKDHVYVCATETKDSNGVSVDIISFDSGDADVHAAQQVCCPYGYSEGGADFCAGGHTDYNTSFATFTV